MKCALIGLGMVADTHLAAIADISGLDLSGVIGRDSARAQAFADRAADKLGYDVPVCPDIRALADKAKPDLVILATPPDARRAQVMALAEAGVPILMEKPLERTLDAASALVETCEDADVPLGIVFQHRARAASLALKKLINEGSLGPVASIEIRVPWWRDQSYYDAPGRGTFARDGGGVVITQAIHTLDLALWLAGPVASLQARLHRTPLHDLEAEDWAGALLSFASGAVGHFFATTAAYPGSAESISIQGTKAHAKLEGDALQVRYLDGREENFGSASGTGGGADPMAFSHGWHQTVIEDFMQSIKTGREPLCSGRSGLAVHRVIDAMARASASGSTVAVNTS